MRNIKKLLLYIGKRRQKQYILVLIFMLFSSLTEVVSLGAIVPFIGALATPDIVYNHELMQPIISFLEISSPKQLIAPMTSVFIFAAILSAIMRFSLLYVTTKLTQMTGADISIEIYRRTLYQKYEVHVSRNSSLVINGMIVKINAVTNGIIGSSLNMISALLMIIAVFSVLLAINVSVSIVSIVFFGLSYYLVALFTRKKVYSNSQVISERTTKMIKSIQEGLGGIRDVLIDGTQDFYSSIYHNSDIQTRKAVTKNIFIRQTPRYVMELIGVTFISVFAYILSLQEGGLLAVMPILAVLAMSAQRLIPSLQQLYSSYSSIIGSLKPLNDVIDLLEQPFPAHLVNNSSPPVYFKDEFSLINVFFRYNNDGSFVLNNINLTIKKGQRIGFIGQTGSGKSTLVDIIMGLLTQSSGSIMIDNKLLTEKDIPLWQKNIAHVPQNIYLSDSSVEENIAFGVSKDKIDKSQVKKAAKESQISHFIESLPDKYETLVGERGVRLSGGQRQRIGIARALYKKSNFLVFDEATSALDNNTEELLIKSIDNLDKSLTILIIAHRITTLRNCDSVVEIQNDGSLSVCKYEDIVKN